MKKKIYVEQKKIINRMKNEQNEHSFMGQCIIEDMIELVEEIPEANVIEIPDNGIGEVSDGRCTFNELYNNEAEMLNFICGIFPDYAWKTRTKNRNAKSGNSFVVGVDTPNGRISCCFDLKYWNIFKVKEVLAVPEYISDVSLRHCG